MYNKVWGYFMKFLNLIILLSIILFNPISAFAGYAKLNIYNNNPDIKVVKYEIRYGVDKKEDPALYTRSTTVIPESPTIGQTSCDVKFEGSGLFYVSVKDYYEDGTASDFSKPFLLNVIPKKITNPAIKAIGN